MRPTTDSESLLLRSPKASEGQGGALGEAEALRRGNTVGVRDQVMDLVASQGLLVSRQADNLLPTPNTMEHLPARTPEKIAESKQRTPGGYANLRESVVNDLMPTPTARDYKDGSTPHERDGVVQTDTVARAVFHSGEILLPTTTASDWKGANRSGSKSASANMLAAKIDLLPTTTTNGNERKGPGYASAGILQELEIANGILPKEYEDWEQAAAKTKSIPEEKSSKTALDETTSWGKFEPAIRRWEQTLGRPAPAPTKPDGKDGAHRLSSKFTEWMMGLPDGWITNCGLSRNEELKACGNGVVPQQAELALRILLEGLTIERVKND